jgi:integrase
LEQARGKARELLARWNLGEDVLTERKSSRSAPLLEELIDAFLSEADAKRKASTAYEYRRILVREVLPRIGKTVAGEVRPADVAKLHREIGVRAPVLANRVLRLLRTIYRWAIQRGELPDGTNPTRGVAPFQERAKEKYLTPDEVARLGSALKMAETVGLPADPVRTSLAAKRRPNGKVNVKVAPANPYAVAAIRFLLFSGWREQEALTLRWDSIDFSNQRVELGDTKTGRSHRPLGRSAMGVLVVVPKVEGSPFVFPGRNPSRPLREIKHLWQAVRAAAGITDVRLHDLRHTFASAALEQRISLEELAKLLGHRDSTSTARYAHHRDDLLRDAADTVASLLESRLG